MWEAWSLQSRPCPGSPDSREVCSNRCAVETTRVERFVSFQSNTPLYRNTGLGCRHRRSRDFSINTHTGAKRFEREWYLLESSLSELQPMTAAAAAIVASIIVISFSACVSWLALKGVSMVMFKMFANERRAARELSVQEASSVDDFGRIAEVQFRR